MQMLPSTRHQHCSPHTQNVSSRAGNGGKTRPPAPASQSLNHTAFLVSHDGPRRLSLQVWKCWAPVGGDTAWRLLGTPQGVLSPMERSADWACPPSRLGNPLVCVGVFTSVFLGRIQEGIRVSRLRARISVTLEMAFVPLAACLACGSGPILFTFLERHCLSHIRWKKFTDRHRDHGCLWRKEFATSDDQMKLGRAGHCGSHWDLPPQGAFQRCWETYS